MNDNLRKKSLFSLGTINSTRLWVMVFGILDGLGGIVHGLYETLRGFTPTAGFYLENFGAFSAIPNYLVTGITVIIISLFITTWTFGFIHRKNGPIVLLLLTILLFFTGGGVAQLIFGLIAWGVSMQINKPLTRWEKILPEHNRQLLAKSWLAIFITGYILLTIGIGIWLILLPPGINHNNEPIINDICWLFLGVGLIFQIPTVVAGFARDIERSKC